MTAEQDEQALLDEHAHYVAGFDRYAFGNGLPLHDRAGALAVIRFHLQLGRPVTDVLTAQTLAAIVDRLVVIEQRIGLH